MFRKSALFVALGSLALLAACGGSSSPLPQPITISLSSASATAPLNAASPAVTVTIQRMPGDTNPVTLTVSQAPSGVVPQITSPGTGDSGSIVLSAAAGAAPGTYPLLVNATEGGTPVAAPLSLTVLSSPVTVNVTVSPVVNTSVGFAGQLQTVMTTQFQAAEWDESFFQTLPGATTTLANLEPEHIRVYTSSLGIPQRADKSWDFSVLDATLDPVISVGDKSINMVLVQGPPWMCTDIGPNCVLQPQNYPDFANYAAQMVQYYNTTTGFTDGNGVQHVHTPFTPITYWSIYTIPDLVGMTPQQYANLYNLTVTAMQNAGSLVPLKFVALELSGVTDANDYAPAFLDAVTAQIDVVSQQQYAVCGWFYSDATAMGAVPYNFGQYARDFANIVATSPKLSNAVLWMTENNVDADFEGSGCSNPFEIDPRGTSSFFAGWRPYVFSQWAQAGSHTVVHSDFDQDASDMSLMYAEVAYATAQPYISYWVDYNLGHYFPYCQPDEPPACQAPTSNILTVSTSEPAGSQTVEILATANSDGSVVVMAANHAVNGPNDDNGPGAPRNLVIDISQLGNFSSATELTIDASLIDPNTNLATEPVAESVVPAPQMTLNMGGYGVTFLKLLP